MKDLIQQLNWRYATKIFDPERQISEHDLHFVLESIRLTATSYGLQPFKVLHIQNEDIRQQLRGASFDKAQITDASEFLVFCNRTQLEAADLDAFMQRVSKARSESLEDLAGFSKFLQVKMIDEATDLQHHWTAKQAYIALGTALTTCAMLEIDSCPIEGMLPKKYNQILNLKDTGYETAFALAIGYRSEQDKYQHKAKVRCTMDEMIQIV